jgi:hypothetical protein
VGMSASSGMMRLVIDQNASVCCVSPSALWQCPEISFPFLFTADTVPDIAVIT